MKYILMLVAFAALLGTATATSREDCCNGGACCIVHAACCH